MSGESVYVKEVTYVPGFIAVLMTSSGNIKFDP